MSILNVIASGAPTREFADGETIFAEGEPADGYMYAVIEGRVEILKASETLETVETGGIFGELALLDQLPRSAAAVSRGTSRVAAISETGFKEILLRNPGVTLEILRILVKRVRRNLPHE